MSAAGHGLAARLLTGTLARVALHDPPPSPSSTGGATGHIELHGAPAWWCTVGKEQIEPRSKPPAQGGQEKWEGSVHGPPPSDFAAHPLPRSHFCCSHRSHHRREPSAVPVLSLTARQGWGMATLGRTQRAGPAGCAVTGVPRAPQVLLRHGSTFSCPPPTPMQRCQTHHVYCHSVPCTQAGLSPSAPSGRILGSGGVCSSCSHASDAPAADGCWWGGLPGGLPVPGPRSVAHRAKTLLRDGGKSSKV